MIGRRLSELTIYTNDVKAMQGAIEKGLTKTAALEGTKEMPAAHEAVKEREWTRDLR